MKKLTALVLCLVLLISLTLSANAMMVSTTVSSDGSEEQVQAAAAVGDTIYYTVQAVHGQTLRSRTVDNAAGTELATINTDEGGVTFDDLFSWNDKLYGINRESDAFYLLLDDTGAFAPVKQTVTLDLSAIVSKDDEGSNYATLKSLFSQDDYLYYSAQNYNDGMSMTAGRINLTTGKNTSFKTGNIVCLTPYQDGKLVAYIYDLAALYSNNSAAAEGALSDAGICAVFDPEKDAVETSYPITTDSQFGGMMIGGFCYGNNSVYYTAGSKIMGLNMTTGESRVSAYTASGMFGGNSTGTASYVGGYYMTFGYEGFSIYKLDSENIKNGALRIFGEMGGEAHKSFVKNYPDIPVEVGDDYTIDLEAITQAMVSDTNPYDVLLLSLNYMPVDRLLKKGYCADLSDQTELWELVKQMYPEFGEVLQKDGKLYGVPVDASAYTYGVNMDLWKELGLTEADLPTSLPGLLDFAANWVYDYGEDNPDIYLFNYSQSSQMLFSIILQNYMSYVQYKGEDMLFNTPAYKDILKAFEAVDFTEIDSLMDKDTMYVPENKALFSLYTPLIPMTYASESIKPLYLSFAEGEEAAVPIAMTVMIINPKSTRKDEAILYMKNYLENLPKDAAYVTLFPEHNDQVEVKGYQRDLDDINEQIKVAQKRLETADAENKAGIQDEIKSLEETLAYAEEHRYSLTTEQITNYRDVIKPHLFVQRQNLLYSASNEALGEINTLMMQYLAKGIDSDKMISELDNRLRLMALEDN